MIKKIGYAKALRICKEEGLDMNLARQAPSCLRSGAKIFLSHNCWIIYGYASDGHDVTAYV
jgi:hypothetical protein